MTTPICIRDTYFTETKHIYLTTTGGTTLHSVNSSLELDPLPIV